MNKQQAIKLLPLVNNHESMTLLDFYVDTRAEEIKELLTTADMSSCIRYQAQIEELRKLKKLRDTVIKVGNT